MIALVALATLLYGAGLLRVIRLRRRFPPSRAVAYAAGLAVAVASVVGPMDDLADASLTWHMAQHFVLIGIVAPLLVAGSPLRLLLGALPRRGAERVARIARGDAARFATHPVVAALQFLAMLYVVHFSPLFEAALEHEPVHALEHLVFVASAALFWQAIFAPAPAPFAAPHPMRILTLLVALPLGSFLGFALYVARAPLYAHYAALPGAEADQQRAGALMWLGGGAPLFLALLWCALDWQRDERHRTELRERREALAC